MRSLKDRINKDSWKTLQWMDDEIESIEKSKAMESGRSCPKCTDVNFISTFFGNSKTIIDWCPGCHSIWLDQADFQEIIQYLNDKLNDLTSEEMKSMAFQEIKEIFTGPEDKLSEIADAKAAILALINITIFEHPKLYSWLTNFFKSIPIR